MMSPTIHHSCIIFSPFFSFFAFYLSFQSHSGQELQTRDSSWFSILYQVCVFVPLFTGDFHLPLSCNIHICKCLCVCVFAFVSLFVCIVLFVYVPLYLLNCVCAFVHGRISPGPVTQHTKLKRPALALCVNWIRNFKLECLQLNQK